MPQTKPWESPIASGEDPRSGPQLAPTLSVGRKLHKQKTTMTVNQGHPLPLGVHV